MRIWGAIASGLVQRGGAVLISIREAKGSSPRDAGTRMVVFADGTYTGTIGGGTLEWRAIAEAQRLLSRADFIADPSTRLAPPESSAPLLSSPASPKGDAGDDNQETDQTGPMLVTAYSARSYALGPELGQCCGGRVTLAFELIDPRAVDQVREMARHETQGPFTVATRLDHDRMTRQVVTVTGRNDERPPTETFGDHVRTLFLFGAGHVGRALVLALAPLPFRVIWIDSRPDAFPSVVPGNVTMICPADPLEALADPDAGSFALIMTHSHELDLALCDRALRSQRFGYVGVIGSATKRARFERRLIAGGLAPDRVADLVCPIGAMGPKSKLPQVIAAATVVELLVKDEICLKVVQSDAAPEREAVTSAAERLPEQSLAEPGSAWAKPAVRGQLGGN